MNKLVQALPQNLKAKNLLADVFEQIGYQQENPGLRNSCLVSKRGSKSTMVDASCIKGQGIQA